MSTLNVQTLRLPAARFHGESSLPMLSVHAGRHCLKTGASIDECDGLYLNYGGVGTAYPYRAQDLYDRSKRPREFPAVVLENEHLRAVFLPDFGGKLWSLTDRHTGRELLFTNSIVRPCNLAVRNAWMSGGVEWNCGFLGHGPYTCSRLHTARTALDDGTPVLRFYYFERIRCAVVQMDFFLPDGARTLFARMRVTNPTPDVVPMYWWSNIAVPQREGDRVIVPADAAFSAVGGVVEKLPIPHCRGIDATVPLANRTAFDYFFATREDERHYVTQLGADGYGLFQTSTRQQLGRKLFVWGNRPGGARWMRFLTADGEDGSYDEIQCGLAHSQYECLPMPPQTTWEWCEAYGALAADPAAIHGDWEAARREASARIADILPETALETLLADTAGMARRAAEQILFPMNDGWGALEQLRRRADGEAPLPGHLDFGRTGAAQADFVRLLREGTLGEHDPDVPPAAYMRQPAWTARIAQAANGADSGSWYAHYLLGTILLTEGETEAAETHLRRSLALTESAWAHYALSVALARGGKTARALSEIRRAAAMRPEDVSLAKEYFRALWENEKFSELLRAYPAQSAVVRENKRCQLYFAAALAETGHLREAEEILCGSDGHTYLVVPDIREGEVSVTQLWYKIQRARGIPEEQIGPVPLELDFRMNDAPIQ